MSADYSQIELRIAASFAKDATMIEAFRNKRDIHATTAAKVFKVPLEKVNVNGGAIALGHPVGATGAMLVSTLLDELERRDLRYGLCTLCAAGGMAVATIIERIS